MSNALTTLDMRSGVVLRESGNLAIAAERLAARIALGKQALAADPGNRTARRMLAESLIQANLPDSALALLATDASNGERDLGSLTALARAQFATQAYGAVLSTLDLAHTCPGFGREQLLLRFEALLKQGQHSTAHEMLAEIRRLDPCNAAALKLLAHNAFQQGNPNAVLEACDRILASMPGDTSALHYRMVALALLNCDAEAAAAMGMDRFVVVQGLPIEADGRDRAGFHRRLIAEIRSDPSLRPDPKGLATRHGWQTLSRSRANGPTMASLIASICAAVENYARALPCHDMHPYVACRPSRGTLLFWSVLYSGAGQQRSHFHPGGWLSGVYHASGDGSEASGSLVLGDCDYLQASHKTPPWGRRALPSRAGQLIMFPSFTPHATTTPAPGTERLSVAFDVMRCE